MLKNKIERQKKRHIIQVNHVTDNPTLLVIVCQSTNIWFPVAFIFPPHFGHFPVTGFHF